MSDDLRQLCREAMKYYEMLGGEYPDGIYAGYQRFLMGYHFDKLSDDERNRAMKFTAVLQELAPHKADWL